MTRVITATFEMDDGHNTPQVRLFLKRTLRACGLKCVAITDNTTLTATPATEAADAPTRDMGAEIVQDARP